MEQELASLRRAVRDAQSRKPKTPKQHREDEDWLDWAIRKAKQYAPEIAELLAGLL